MTTIYDVAKRAGVSIATVSRVINKKDNVSEKTCRRVKKVIKELEYNHNMVAAALMKKKTHTIGLLIPDIANLFFAEITRGVEDVSNLNGFNIIICNTDYGLEKEKMYIELLKQKGVDGLIISSTSSRSEAILKLIKADYPVVLLNREIEGLEEGMVVDSVVSDHVKGGYLATKHLIDLGHKKIAALLGPEQIKLNRLRGEGYQKALVEKGILPSGELMMYGEFKIDSGYKRGLELLRRPNHPTAFFAANDLIALGIIRAAKELGLQVPESTSIVGYDNTVLARITDPPLTTIDQQMTKMGKIAAERLLKRIKGKEEPGRQVVLETELVIRMSACKTIDT